MRHSAELSQSERVKRLRAGKWSWTSQRSNEHGASGRLTGQELEVTRYYRCPARIREREGEGLQLLLAVTRVTDAGLDADEERCQELWLALG